VESVAGALGLLGITKLRCLADLLASSHDVLHDADAIARGASRARMAAALLADTGAASSGVLAGLLSVSDRLYGASLGETLDELPLPEELTTAILGGHGPVGRELDIIRACEQDDRVRLDELAPGRSDELLGLHGSIGRQPASQRADRSSWSEVPEPA
ncbi:MAG: hypothetical protein ACM3MM_00430, partial [Acidobacteriota bacterium]